MKANTKDVFIGPVEIPPPFPPNFVKCLFTLKRYISYQLTIEAKPFLSSVGRTVIRRPGQQSYKENRFKT